MKKLLKLAALSAMTAAALTGPLWAEGQYWAVVVGIDDYAVGDIPKLKYAVADAKLFAQVLQDRAKVPADHIRLLTSDTVSESLQPRLTNVMQNLSELRKNVKSDDTLIFYFAGHGLTVNEQSFLLTEESDNRSEATLRNSSIRNDELKQVFKEANARHALIIIDACRNRTGDKTTDQNLQKLNKKLESSINPGEIARERGSVIFSCNVGEQAWEWDEKKHGFFSYFLTEGMKSGAADSQGRITLAGLANYVKGEVHRFATQATKSPQTPIFSVPPSQNNLDWVLATGDANKNASSNLTKDLNTDRYIIELEQAQVRVDHKMALGEYLQQRALAVRGRRNELSNRLLLLEKLSPKAPDSEFIRQRRAEIKKLASQMEDYSPNYAAYGAQPRASGKSEQVAPEYERLTKENLLLSYRVEIQEAKSQLSTSAVARSTALKKEVDQWQSNLAQIPSDDTSLARPIAERRLIAAKVALLEEGVNFDSSKDQSIHDLLKERDQQYLARLAAEYRASFAETALVKLTAQLEYLNARLEATEALLQKKTKEAEEYKAKAVALDQKVELLTAQLRSEKQLRQEAERAYYKNFPSGDPISKKNLLQFRRAVNFTDLVTGEDEAQDFGPPKK